MYDQSYEDYLNMVLGIQPNYNSNYADYNRNDYLNSMQTNYSGNNYLNSMQMAHAGNDYLNSMQTAYNGNNNFNNMQTTAANNTYGMSRQQLEAFLPDIYRIINPLVVRTWNINTRIITKELIEEVTEQIYDTVNDHKEIRLNINLTNFAQDVENRSESGNKEEKGEATALNESEKTTVRDAKEIEKRVTRNVKDTKIDDSIEDRHEQEEVHTNYLLKDLIKIMVIKDLMERQTVTYVSMPQNRQNWMC